MKTERDEVLQFDDVCKLDFGVQVGRTFHMQVAPALSRATSRCISSLAGGRIVDCAFTIAFNQRHLE